MKYLEPEQYGDEALVLVDRTIDYGEIIGLRGTHGLAVLMSQEEYDAILETIHLMRSPRVTAEILEAADELIEDCVAEQDIEW